MPDNSVVSPTEEVCASHPHTCAAVTKASAQLHTTTQAAHLLLLQLGHRRGLLLLQLLQRLALLRVFRHFMVHELPQFRDLIFVLLQQRLQSAKEHALTGALVRLRPLC